MHGRAVPRDLREHGQGLVTDAFLTAADLGRGEEAEENAAFKTVLPDRATGEPVVPGGSLGFRWGETGRGRWNLDLGDVVPESSLIDRAGDTVEIALPRPGLPGNRSASYEDATQPCTPAWQETTTSVPAEQSARIAREFARNAERTQGRAAAGLGQPGGAAPCALPGRRRPRAEPPPPA
ncbi:hypothetical protein ADL12_45610 [Streptomyces regalis]|uniref:Uncharacterized protein n=1 Tax=Streptomyces regalis TaxID=68262 RepID=A0A117MJP1_9ACTN|nr:hypothetical protein [Streptomyces regalis]KUL21114.1 hypothetical protein ADL12_45610 [Streptomyces regalis]